MNDIYDENSIYMNEKNIQFTNTINEKIIFKSDPERIKQVFTNIIKNSVDFVPEKAGKIEIGAKSDGNKILFYVKDNGIGISKERQKDIFKKFYQIDTSLKRKHGGTGLGLSICEGIVKGLGGEIWIDDTTEKGTMICFSLPIQTFGNSLKS
jgi:signal transduction histidine kinase